MKSVQFIGGSGTRSDGDNPLYYVVNYENEGGFAVLGADTRLDGVYAISDGGHLNMDDTTFNLGLNVFFRSLPNMPDRPVGPDTLITEPQPFQPIGEKYENVSYKSGPFLTQAVRKWDQGYPYNTFCPTRMVKHEDPYTGTIGIINKPCLVECCNIAVGQIMSFYECPKTYGEYTFNWAEMKQWQPVKNFGLPLKYEPAPEGGVARLLRELGKEGNMKTDYGLESSGTKIKKYYKRTFKTFEYKEPGDFKTFSTDDLFYWVYRKEKPVLVIGRNDAGIGHAWVVDGMLCDMWRYSNNLGDVSYSGEGYFFHVVWGWGGDCNGYFKHGSGFTQVTFKFREEGDPVEYIWKNRHDQYAGTSYDWYEMVKIYSLGFCGDINPR